MFIRLTEIVGGKKKTRLVRADLIQHVCSGGKNRGDKVRVLFISDGPLVVEESFEEIAAMLCPGKPVERWMNDKGREYLPTSKFLQNQVELLKAIAERTEDKLMKNAIKNVARSLDFRAQLLLERKAV